MTTTDDQLLQVDVIVPGALQVGMSEVGYVTNYVPSPKTFGDLDYSDPVIASSDTEILQVEVDENDPNRFIVTAVATGNAVVTATIGSYVARAVVLVRDVQATSTHVTISTSDIAIDVDSRTTIEASADNDRQFKIVSSDPSIMEVEGTQVVGLNEGSAYLKAIGLNVTSNRAYLTINKPGQLTDFTMNVPVDGVGVGWTGDVEFEYNYPGSYNPVVESSDESVVSVDGHTLSSLSAGVVQITSTLNGMIRSLPLVVTGSSTIVLPESITSNPITGNVGDTGTIDYQVLPSDATDKLVEFTSNNSEVVEVRSDGSYVLTGEGQTTVTISMTNFPDITIEVQVESIDPEVQPIVIPVTSVAITSGDILDAVGATGTLTYEVAPSDATNPGVVITSNDNSVVQIDQLGNWTLIESGSTTITVSSADNPSISDEISVEATEP